MFKLITVNHLRGQLFTVVFYINSKRNSDTTETLNVRIKMLKMYFQFI